MTVRRRKATGEQNAMEDAKHQQSGPRTGCVGHATQWNRPHILWIVNHPTLFSVIMLGITYLWIRLQRITDVFLEIPLRITSVIDVVPFNGENEIYAIRMHELQDVVDQFFVFEGECDFRGRQRTSRWNDHLIVNLKDRIHRVVVPCSVCNHSDPWDNEKGFREFAKDYVLENGFADENTLVILSDADEIPRADAIRSVLADKSMINRFDDPDFALRLEGDPYYQYNVRCRRRGPWQLGPKITGIGFLQKHGYDTIRHYKAPLTIKKGAWHMTSFMSAGLLSRKNAEISDVLAKPLTFQSDADNEYRIKNCLDPYDRPERQDMEYQEHIADIPIYMKTHKADLPDYFYGHVETKNNN